MVLRWNGTTFEILTQMRDTSNKPEDKVYDKTLEATAESSLAIFPWESVLVTAKRGIGEETGAKPSEFKILGAEGREIESLVTSTGKNDRLMVCNPYCFSQTLEGSRPLFAPCFIALVGESFIPRADGAGEVKGFFWWDPDWLRKELQNNARQFSFTHPVLLKVCNDLIDGDLKSRLIEHIR